MWIRNDLELMRLQDPSQGVEEHACIVRCPEVDVDCVDFVQVFALVVWIGHWEVPL